MAVGDEFIVGDVFGDISYRGEGLFIAGGAGITPFIPIFKQLIRENKLANNKLLYANKTRADIILKETLASWFGNNVTHVLSNEKHVEYLHGYINKSMITQSLHKKTQYIYLCGPHPMVEMIERYCIELGLSQDQLVKEEF